MKGAIQSRPEMNLNKGRKTLITSAPNYKHNLETKSKSNNFNLNQITIQNKIRPLVQTEYSEAAIKRPLTFQFNRNCSRNDRACRQVGRKAITGQFMSSLLCSVG